jgi:hypothetical protein
MNFKKRSDSEKGSTIAMAMLAVVLLGGFVAVAVDYTNNIARNAQRDRAFNNAVEVGDGAISQAFASWRQICKTSGVQAPNTTAFNGIPGVASTNYPSFPSATLSNFQVKAVDPLMNDIGVNDTPPKATGPGTGTFSYFYLASADVTIPAVNGSLVAQVRRVFEKRYTSPWNWAMMYNGNLEMHPDSSLTLNGWVHSNADVYVGNGSTDPLVTPSSTLTFNDRLSYQGNYTVGFDPSDGAHGSYVNVATPNYDATLPPGHEQFYSLFGWDSTQFNATDANPNNDNYHELVEKPTSGYTDPFASQRMYAQAYNVADSSGNYGVVINVDASNNITVGYAGTTYNSQPNGNSAQAQLYAAVTASVHPNYTIQDNREQASVRVINFDVSQFNAATKKNFNNIIYINDTSASATNHRAVRIVNGATLLTGGLSIVSPNPVYIQGDFNTGRTASSETPSNTGNPTDPEAGSYTRKPASIVADAITLLSNGWNDANSTAGLGSRVATNTTVNAALVGGNVPSNGSSYSGGGENFVRFMEDWTGKTFTYYGSMICPFSSTQGIGTWGAANVYAAPQQNWYFDDKLSVDSSGNPVSVPGYVSTVAYLQQQRWYLKYGP